MTNFCDGLSCIYTFHFGWKYFMTSIAPFNKFSYRFDNNNIVKYHMTLTETVLSMLFSRERT